jgi:ABC-2 type transport system ATP-binding protein
MSEPIVEAAKLDTVKTDAPKAAPVIKTDKLTKKFGDFTAAHDLTFEIYPGEIFGFLGANGAGKTTAIRMLCGLLLPTSGKATVAGFDVYKETEKIKRSIGYMSQKFSLYDDLTVWENIRLYAGIYGLTDEHISERGNQLLDALGMHDQVKTFVRDLPLGWKQKLAFSVAVLHEPKIVFLDEPTSGVDPIARREFWELIYNAASRGVTVFITTHYMDEAEYCNRISIMVDGNIRAFGTPAELKAHFNVATMDEVFYGLAREAKRSED